MTVPVLAFFNNKGGVGKTSLAYHLAWMLDEMGRRVLVMDLDPQANITAAFLDEDRLVEIWEDHPDLPNTIFRCLRPLLEVGNISTAISVPVGSDIGLVPGDLALSGFEDEIATQWPKEASKNNLNSSDESISFE